MYDEEDCCSGAKKLNIPNILTALFAFVIIAYIVGSIVFVPVKFLQLDQKLKAVIRLQVNGVHNYQRKQETLKETSLETKKKFIRITGDSAFNTLLKDLRKQTSIYVESKRRETENSIKDRITGEISTEYSAFDDDDDIQEDNKLSHILFDISPKTNTPTEFGFVGSFDNLATQIFIGAAPLIEYEKASIKIKQWKLFYPLPENSVIYRIGKTSSCLLKKKSGHSPTFSVNSGQLCNIQNNNTLSIEKDIHTIKYKNLLIPNRGETPTIHLEHLCEMKYNSRKSLNDDKKISFYSSPNEILRNKDKSNTENKDILEVIYITSLDYYMENQNKFDEIHIDGISCKSTDAPLSSDAFLFVNKRGSLANVIKGMLKDTIKSGQIDGRRLGLIEYNKNWEEEEKRFYPSMNE